MGMKSFINNGEVEDVFQSLWLAWVIQLYDLASLSAELFLLADSQHAHFVMVSSPLDMIILQ
jgi:hypothetical protein